MLLYHGTTAKNLTSILRHGLLPRDMRPSLWSEYPSRSDCVYFSTCNAFYYAMSMSPGERSLVVEIDTERLDSSRFMPDEDFVVQILAAIGRQNIGEIHDEVRDNLDSFVLQVSDQALAVGRRGELEEVEPSWHVSLRFFGTCGHRGVVPPSAITRYVLFDYPKRPLLSAIAYNNAFGPIHSRRIGEQRELNQHKANLTAWFFGDRKKLPRMIPKNFAQEVSDPRGKAYLLNPDWRREVAWRGGIEVVTLATHCMPS